jgi:hypothetical protein
MLDRTAQATSDGKCNVRMRHYASGEDGNRTASSGRAYIFSNFVSHILARTARVEEDLVDQLFNSTEKRLARLLLLLANFEGRSARTAHGEDHSGDAGGDGRHHPIAGKPFHEQVSSSRVHRLQRSSRSPQFLTERGLGRTAAHCKIVAVTFQWWGETLGEFQVRRVPVDSAGARCGSLWRFLALVNLVAPPCRCLIRLPGPRAR